MRRSLFWKLLAINVLVVGIAMTAAAVHVGRLADHTFSRLMRDFHIEVAGLHGRFTADLTGALIQASLIAAGIGLLLSLVLFRGVVRPIRAMTAMAGRIASGDYGVRASSTSSDEVGQLALSLNTMAESLDTLERLRKDLVANVAHELRTPLSNLRGYLEAIRDGVTTASPETVSLLHEEVMRLVRLTQGLHELSLFDASAPHLRWDAVDIGALVRRLLDLRRAEFTEKRITVQSDVAVPGPVHAVPDLLSQALHNLIDNAVRYTPEGGDVAVTVSQAGAAVKIAVRNSGGGIAAEDLPFIFERFYRGEKSRSRDSGGAGIGLAIVTEVARVHGGEVGATSQHGETTVWLTLAAASPRPARR
ncbi:MAG: ATP-binding protein [Armatimonadota bacterium]|nr:ATP-binding protein [Armatimonadota bacterium]